MSDQTVSVKAENLKDTITKLCKVIPEVFGDQGVSLEVHPSIPNLPLSVGLTADDYPNNAEIKQYLSQIKGLDCLDCHQFRVSFNDPGSGERGSFQYNTTDYMVGYLNFDELPHLFDVFKLLKSFKKHFTLNTRKALRAELLTASEKEGLNSRETAIDDLTGTLKKLETFTANQIQENAKHVTDITKAVDTKFQKREVALEKKYELKEAALDEKHETRESKLAKNEEDFQERVKTFDERESKHVRRELLGKMRELIEAQKSVSLSKETTKKRIPIQRTCFMAAYVGICLIVTGVMGMFFAKTFAWFFYLPFAAGSILFASTLIYFLKWENQWSHQHSQAEFQNLKFSSDILRASWIAELLFEWDKEKNKEFPKELIDRFAHNLFTNSHTDSPDHPVEELTGLMKKISKLKVGRGMLEIKRKHDKQDK